MIYVQQVLRCDHFIGIVALCWAPCVHNSQRHNGEGPQSTKWSAFHDTCYAILRLQYSSSRLCKKQSSKTLQKQTDQSYSHWHLWEMSLKTECFRLWLAIKCALIYSRTHTDWPTHCPAHYTSLFLSSFLFHLSSLSFTMYTFPFSVSLFTIFTAELVACAKRDTIFSHHRKAELREGGGAVKVMHSPESPQKFLNWLKRLSRRGQ